MNATMTTTKKTKKLYLNNTTHTCCSRQDADDSAQRDCNLPIHSQIEIPREVGFIGSLQKFGEGYPHIWELPVLHYHGIMVIYPYPFLVVITQLFS